LPRHRGQERGRQPVEGRGRGDCRTDGTVLPQAVAGRQSGPVGPQGGAAGPVPQSRKHPRPGQRARGGGLRQGIQARGGAPEAWNQGAGRRPAVGRLRRLRRRTLSHPVHGEWLFAFSDIGSLHTQGKRLPMNRLLIAMAPAEGWRPLRGPIASGCLLVLSLCLPAVVRAQDKPANELTPEQQRLKERADALNKEAVKLYYEGRYAESTKLLQELLQIEEGLYPGDKYPFGHPALARSLNNLGTLLQAQGEYTKAFPYYEKALAACERL